MSEQEINNMDQTESATLLEPFEPAVLFSHQYTKDVSSSGKGKPLVIAMQRSETSISHYKTKVCTDNKHWIERSKRYIERLVKFLLWSYGAHTIHIAGSEELANYLKKVYSPTGTRQFDYEFMSRVYEKPLRVISYELGDLPEESKISQVLGGHLNGFRIGFDLGASDVKVSAIQNGKTIFSTEVEWHPRDQDDPNYHKETIRNLLKLAASKLPKVEAIGGSSAGVYINNRPRIASIFRGIPYERFHEVETIFSELASEFNVPLIVINDGEVSALAGAMALSKNNVLGLAMGSSEAVGYIDSQGNITDYLNELAFAPIDVNPRAPVDEWSGDAGVGANYLSQQAVFRLAPKVGIVIPEELSLASKLEYVQGYLEKGHDGALKIWKTIGSYLGYALAHYADFYLIDHVLILGRVTSGQGGSIIVDETSKVLNKHFPKLAKTLVLHLPDEKTRRVGQSIAAASLPMIER